MEKIPRSTPTKRRQTQAEILEKEIQSLKCEYERLLIDSDKFEVAKQIWNEIKNLRKKLGDLNKEVLL